MLCQWSDKWMASLVSIAFFFFSLSLSLVVCHLSIHPTVILFCSCKYKNLIDWSCRWITFFGKNCSLIYHYIEDERGREGIRCSFRYCLLLLCHVFSLLTILFDQLEMNSPWNEKTGTRHFYIHTCMRLSVSVCVCVRVLECSCLTNALRLPPTLRFMCWFWRNLFITLLLVPNVYFRNVIPYSIHSKDIQLVCCNLSFNVRIISKSWLVALLVSAWTLRSLYKVCVFVFGLFYSFCPVRSHTHTVTANMFTTSCLFGIICFSVIIRTQRHWETIDLLQSVPFQSCIFVFAANIVQSWH